MCFQTDGILTSKSPMAKSLAWFDWKTSIILQSANQQQQQPSSVDQQQEQEQSSSKTAAETHSILIVNQSEPTIHYFLTVNGNDGAEVFDEGHRVLDSTRYSGAQYPFTENAPEVSDR